ncbi:MAG: helix-turn-helix transcriptional regulator, partial [Ignavibacteriae bacterium]
YLEKTHAYYTKTQVPLIEKLFNELLRHRPAGGRNLVLLKKFFLEYKKELLEHLEREEKTTFPYIKKVYRLFHTTHPSGKDKRALSKYSMHVYEEEHYDVDEKLYDLKNILIKYVHGTNMQSVYHEVIFELFRLEKDIQDHTRIENNILLPLVAEMEDTLFYPEEHSRRTVGKKALATSDPHPLQPDRQPDAGGGEKKFKITAAPSETRANHGLTSRELAVLQLVGCGMLNKQIADKLEISQHTVISHRKNITRKLQIKTVAGLTIYALINGLISPRNIT